MLEVSQGLKAVFAAIFVLNKFQYITGCIAQFQNIIVKGWAVLYKNWENTVKFDQNYFPIKEGKSNYSSSWSFWNGVLNKSIYFLLESAQPAKGNAAILDMPVLQSFWLQNFEAQRIYHVTIHNSKIFFHYYVHYQPLFQVF